MTFWSVVTILESLHSVPGNEPPPFFVGGEPGGGGGRGYHNHLLRVFGLSPDGFMVHHYEPGSQTKRSIAVVKAEATVKVQILKNNSRNDCSISFELLNLLQSKLI